MTEKLQAIRKISNRLAAALVVLVLLVIGGAFFAHYSPEGKIINAPIAAFAAGSVGGFVGLQRRLKSMSDDDLTLLANSWVFVCLSPFVGGILAVVFPRTQEFECCVVQDSSIPSRGQAGRRHQRARRA